MVTAKAKPPIRTIKVGKLGTFKLDTEKLIEAIELLIEENWNKAGQESDDFWMQDLDIFYGEFLEEVK